MKISVDPTWFSNGFVPSFFKDKGRERYGEGDLSAEFWKESRRCWGLLYIPAFIMMGFGVAAGIIPLLLMYLVGLWNGNEKLWSEGLIQSWSSFAVLVGGVALLLFVGKQPDSDTGRGHDFFASLSKLFQEFGIEANTAVGKMSLEEFRANIENSLKAQGKQVDSLVAFAGINAKAKFNSMHFIALEWELCHESHGKYFPVR